MWKSMLPEMPKNPLIPSDLQHQPASKLMEKLVHMEQMATLTEGEASLEMKKLRKELEEACAAYQAELERRAGTDASQE